MEKNRNIQIINGDGMLWAFQEAGIAGDLLIWREVLSEGPVKSGEIDAAFWEVRSGYLDQADEYKLKDLLLQHFYNIDWNTYDEITLWFEHDLVCQANLIFLLSYLAELQLTKKVSLVCIDRFDGVPNFKGLGQLSPKQLASLYPERISIKVSSFEYATKLWKLYASEDQLQLQEVLSSNRQLRFVNSAFELHLQRFPDQYGISPLQRKLLQIAKDADGTLKNIMQKSWSWDPGFGLTDLSIQQQFILLADCFIGSTFQLSELGNQLLDNKASIKIEDHAVGGASFHDFTWDPLELKITRNEKPS